MDRDCIYILDFGGKEAYYTARKLRSEGFYCELLSTEAANSAITNSSSAKGLMLCGGEVDDENLITLPFSLESVETPILAMGGAARILARQLCTDYSINHVSESRVYTQFENCTLFTDLFESERCIKRLDRFTLPDGYQSLASTSDGSITAFGNPERHIYGIQFSVESNDPEGLTILANFASHICRCRQNWFAENYISDLIEDIRKSVGSSHVLLPVSGGINSGVTAALLSKAIGNRLTCIYIDSLLMRKGDAELIHTCIAEQLGLKLLTVDASDQFLTALQGIKDPDEKRSVLRSEFITRFVSEYIRLGNIDALAESYTYIDILNNKSSLVKNMPDGCKHVAPLKFMFKEDIRALAKLLNLPEDLIHRPSFASSGMSVRCLGEVTPEKLTLLRSADAIFREEVEKANLSHKIAQYFAILTDLHTPGSNGVGYVCVLRALGTSSAGKAPAYKLPYDLMDRLVNRITSELPAINHVVYDITGRPIANVEWE